MNKQQRQAFFARLEVPADRHVVSWYGLPLDEMTKAELRIVINKCCMDMHKARVQGNRLLEPYEFLQIL